MHLEYLESFLAVAELRSFTRAAEQLEISQSSLTKRIRHLESLIGIDLFERTTKNVHLTDAGQLYLEYADQISDLQDEFNMQLARQFSTKEGIILGTIPSSTQYGLTNLISAFIKQTNIPCRIFTSRSEDLEVMLNEGRCNFAFIKNYSGQHNFAQIPITNDSMVAVVPSSHKLAHESAKKASPADFKDDDFFMEPHGSRPYEETVQLCRDNGFTPHVVGTDSQISNIVEYVGLGLGVAFLMRKILPEGTQSNPDVRIIPIEPAVQASIVLCYKEAGKDSALSFAQKQFLEFIEDYQHQSR